MPFWFFDLRSLRKAKADSFVTREASSFLLNLPEACKATIRLFSPRLGHVTDGEQSHKRHQH